MSPGGTKDTSIHGAVRGGDPGRAEETKAQGDTIRLEGQGGIAALQDGGSAGGAEGV